MIVSVFIRRLKPGATFEDFVREWEADAGFGVPAARGRCRIRACTAWQPGNSWSASEARWHGGPASHPPGR